MDHLPKPLDGAKIDVRAYAVRTEYEPELFFSLPGTNKLDFRKLVTQGYPEDRNGLKKKKEFLQEWLFFALLAQCLDRRILLEDFKLNNNNWLTTEKLGQFLKEWATTHQVGTESAHDDVEKMRRYRARWALAEARRYVESHCSMKPAEQSGGGGSLYRRRSSGRTAIALEDKEDLEDLYLSFAILGETLQRTGVLSEDQEEPWYDIVFDDKTWGYSFHNFKTLLKHNPCRAEVRRLESTFSGVLATYCASTMKRPEHNKRPSDLMDHAGCTAAKCISHNLSNNLDSKHFSRFCT